MALFRNKQLINKIILTLLLIFIPLYPKFPLFSVPGSQVAIRLEDFIMLFSAIIWFAINIKEIKKLWQSPITKAVVLFLAAGLISLVFASEVTHTVTLKIAILHWVGRIQYIVPLFIGMTALKSKEDLLYVVRVLVIVIVFATIYGFGQKYAHFPIITTQNEEYSQGIALFYIPGAHLVSTFAGHYDLAAFLVLVSPLFYILFVVKKDLYTRVLFGVIIVMALWLLVNAASRISVAAYLGSITAGLLLVRKYKWVPVAIILSIIFILSASNLMDRYLRIFEVYVERMITVNTTLISYTYAQELTFTPSPTPIPEPVFEDRSTSIRVNVSWPRAIRALEKNPLLGTGYSSTTLATDNNYLRILSEVGLLGFATFFLIIGRIVQQLLTKIHSPRKWNITNYFALALLASLPGILLNMVFIDIMEASKFAILFWLLMGLGVSATRIENEKKNR